MQQKTTSRYAIQQYWPIEHDNLNDQIELSVGKRMAFLQTLRRKFRLYIVQVLKIQLIQIKLYVKQMLTENENKAKKSTM